MSSKRGRKRNDNLPPNRARDVQRAFRARRAAHLQALEQRVSELEAENSQLRELVNWPPADRPPLGKGPTGKDKPKTYESPTAASSSVAAAVASSSSHRVDYFPSRDSSSADSPPSTRTNSLSPAAATATPSSRPMQVISSGSWDHTLMMHEHQSDMPSSSEPPYQLAPMSTSLPSKTTLHYAYDGSMPSSSRNPLPPSNSIYMASQTHYTSANDRSIAGPYSSQSFVMRSNDSLRDPHSRHHDPYTQSPYAPHESASTLHSHSPPPSSTTPVHGHGDAGQRESPIPYTHRRTLTESQNFSIGQGFPHLPNPAQFQQNVRQPDLHRLHDNNGHQTQSYRVAYGPDGRINSLP